VAPLQTCRSCQSAFPATTEYFYLRRDQGKLRTDCKTCFRAAKTARDVSNPEYRRAAARKSYHKPGNDGVSKGATAKVRARQADPARYAAIAERYESGHLAERKARRVELHQLNRVANNASSQAWYYANRERALATSRAWQDSHPDQHKATVVNVRSRQRSAPGAGVSGVVFLRLVEAYGGTCAYCGDPLGDDYEMDHVLALGLGGYHQIENVVPSCRPCNRAKARKTVDAWLQILIREGLAPRIHELALPILSEHATPAIWTRLRAITSGGG
jgi:5-methylcytosine-specific restriction endonuclease McrA